MNMNFIDNWIYQLDDVLAVDGDALPVSGDAITRLGLADGVTYTLVLTAALAQAGGGAFEIVHVIGADGGSYTLERGQEGTDAAEWPAGTLVMATITAAQLAGFGGGGADSGWLTLDSPIEFENPPDARLRNGVVYMRGMKFLPEELLGEYIAQLPEGWWPAAQMEVFVSNGSRTHRIYIEPTGGIFVMRSVGSSGGDYIQFDNLSFPVG